MSTKSIDSPAGAPGPGPSFPEVAPSRLREDDQGLPRTLGLLGAALVLVAALALAFHLYDHQVPLRPGMAVFLLMVGICSMLYHAAFDRDLSFRQLYLGLAVLLLAVGAVFCLIPYPSKVGQQLRYGGPALLLALLFFISA